MSMRLAAGCVAFFILAGCHVHNQSPRSTPVVKRILIISIDGLRSDVAARADAPNLRWLARNGCFTYWATTVEPSLTVASHVSMLTGMSPEKHQVWTNLDWSYQYEDIEEIRPKVPTLFEAAKGAGFTTGMATGKAKFVVLNKPGTLDWQFVPEQFTPDIQVAEKAAEMIRNHRPQVMFVHLPGVDAAGHGSGWGSDEQLQAVNQADRAVGLVLGAVRRAHLMDETVIILTADHGGSGFGHWQNRDANRHIPWIISGPRIKKNLDLTRYPYRDVRTYDTFATACYLMKIPMEQEQIDGRPILEVIDRSELMYDVDETAPDLDDW